MKKSDNNVNITGCILRIIKKSQIMVHGIRKVQADRNRFNWKCQVFSLRG